MNERYNQACNRVLFLCPRSKNNCIKNRRNNHSLMNTRIIPSVLNSISNDWIVRDTRVDKLSSLRYIYQTLIAIINQARALRIINCTWGNARGFLLIPVTTAFREIMTSRPTKLPIDLSAGDNTWRPYINTTYRRIQRHKNPKVECRVSIRHRYYNNNKINVYQMLCCSYLKLIIHQSDRYESSISTKFIVWTKTVVIVIITDAEDKHRAGIVRHLTFQNIQRNKIHKTLFTTFQIDCIIIAYFSFCSVNNIV